MIWILVYFGFSVWQVAIAVNAISDLAPLISNGYFLDPLLLTSGQIQQTEHSTA